MEYSNTLDKCSLDVINKTQSNPFTWKGQFTPDLITYLLNVYADNYSIVADPFSGSGTVLLESLKRSNNCYGFEINPSAFFMSKFYSYSAYSIKQREELMNRVRMVIGSYVMSIPEVVPVYLENKDYRASYNNLIQFANYVSLNAEKDLWPFLINVIFLCEKDKKKKLRCSLIDNINKIKGFLFSLPITKASATVFNEDARTIGEHCNNIIDLIITSPPYVNVFNYHQNYRALIECFGYNILNVANSEFGSNRKNRANRFKTVIQYAMDMGQTLFESSKALKLGGKMVYVVGKESNVCKTPIYNSAVIECLVNLIPSLSVKEFNCRHFVNRFGDTIQEDIITIEKVDNICVPQIDGFRNIGIQHLEKAMEYATPENQKIIRTLLSDKEIFSITPSPIYT